MLEITDCNPDRVKHLERRLLLLEDALTALREATDVLEVLRRGHGIAVTQACYPAINNCRNILKRVNRAEAEEAGEQGTA